MASLMPHGKQYYQDNNGNPLAGGKVYTYSAGTSTPLATYSDAAGATPNTNPIVLDARGEASIFWGSSAYKVVVKDASDIEIWTQDNLQAPSGVADLSSTDNGKGAALVGYSTSGGNVKDALDERLPEIGTYALLRAYSGSYTSIYVRGVSANLDGGAGVFRVDASDTTSADNGGTILVDANGSRWKREFAGDVNVRWFGVAGDGTTDDTDAIQAAIDVVQGTDETLYFPKPASYYRVTGTGLSITGPITIMGSGSRGCYIRNNSGNVLRLTGTHINLSEIGLRSDAGGHVVTQTGQIDQCEWRNVSVIQASGSYSLWDNAGQAFVEIRFRGGWYKHVDAATVPGFNLVSAGGDINDNVWEFLRVDRSGNYFFNIESTGSNFQFANAFRGVNFEVCNGGGIRLVAVQAFEIDNCQNWDASVVGVVTKDFYSINGNASSFGCKGVVRNCGRWAGVNDTGIFDLKLPGSGLGSGIIVENCFSASSSAPFAADLSSNTALVISSGGSRFSATNTSGATIIDPPNKTISFGNSTANWKESVSGTMSTDGSVNVAGVVRGGTTSGSNHRFDLSSSTVSAQSVNNTNASPFGGVAISYTAAAPNGTSNLFINCGDTGASRFQVRSNGGIANFQANDVNLSDARFKRDVQPASSYWDKFRAFEIVTYRYIDQLDDDPNLGVIAQQIEAIAPELVDHSGEFGGRPIFDDEGNVSGYEKPEGPPVMSIYQTDFQFAAAKVLQEAMARIEALESNSASLKINNA